MGYITLALSGVRSNAYKRSRTKVERGGGALQRKILLGGKYQREMMGRGLLHVSNTCGSVGGMQHEEWGGNCG